MRYIGLTSQTLSRRLNQHFQDINRPHRKEHKSNWLRACKRDGISVTIKAIRIKLSLAAAQRVEKQIIKRLRPQLVNVHDGGSSGYAGLPADAKYRHSESGKKRFRNMRQDKRERMLKRLSEMRQKRLDTLIRKVKPVRAYAFEIGIRNKATGETCFVDLKSARQAHKIAGLILKFI